MAGYPNQFLISKDYSGRASLDYAFLRSKGIEFIQQVSGENWTDFNLHDPGVTILEYLCYALTDLAYRSNFSITELLANSNGQIDRTANSFFGKEQILSTAPLNTLDFRKYIIDAVPEIDNIWIEPIISAFANRSIKGHYKVTVQMHHGIGIQQDDPETQKGKEELVIGKIRSMLIAQRNIAEDFDEFIILQPQQIKINAQILIGKNGVPEEILAQIYYLIEKALAPPINFSTEKELLTKGYKMEDIYAGPLLTHGIILDDELHKKTTNVDPSELSRVVFEIDDVIHINHFEIVSEGEIYTRQPLYLKQDHYPILVFDLLEPDIKLYHDNLPLPLKSSVFISLLQRQRDNLKRNYSTVASHLQTYKTLEGTHVKLEEYVSIQTLFPSVYRIGNEGIEESETAARKAKTKQLKAYLMFFEQVLAGFLAQLSNMSNLYSPDIYANPFTYFSLPLYAVPGADTIIKAFTDVGGNWQTFINDPTNDYVKQLQQITESAEDFRRRKKAIFEHMLSRFNIIPDPYPVSLFSSYYSNIADDNRITEDLVWMSNLLKNALVLNNYRNKAINYTVDNYGENAQQGFAFNMRLLLHITNKTEHYTIQSLSKYIKKLSRKKESDEKKNKPDSFEPANNLIKVTIDGETINVITTGYNANKSMDFEFKHQSIRLLSEGTSKKNYKIITAFDKNSNYLIIFKLPEEKNWQIVGQYTERPTAVEALRSFTQKMKKMSIESEGFHFIEHLLLAPDRRLKVFGFKYFNDNGNLMLEQAEWLTYKDREIILSEIKTIALTTDSNKLAECLSRLQGLCTIIITTAEGKIERHTPNDLLQLSTAGINQVLSILIDSLKAVQKEQQRFYPRFHFDIQHNGSDLIPETFFDSQVTIVFPAWPKRFQDKGFREFAQNTFSNNLPVHVKPNFLWLGFSKMKSFEDLHKTWMTSLKTADVETKQNTSAAIRSFLIAENKSA